MSATNDRHFEEMKILDTIGKSEKWDPTQELQVSILLAVRQYAETMDVRNFTNVPFSEFLEIARRLCGVQAQA